MDYGLWTRRHDRVLARWKQIRKKLFLTRIRINGVILETEGDWYSHPHGTSGTETKLEGEAE
jgi:hypothetical protein